MSVPTQTIVSPYGKYGVMATENAPPSNLLKWFGKGLTVSGKSHLAASIGPRCLVIDFEDKHRLINFPGRSQYMVPANLEKLDELIMAVIADGPKPNRSLDMVVFDTADEMVPFIREGMTKAMKDHGLPIPKFGDVVDYGTSAKGGRGWDLVNTRFASYLRKIAYAGYGWGVLTHLKEETYTINEGGKPKEKTRQVPMLNAGVLRPIESLALVRFQTFVRQVGKTEMIVTRTGAKIPGETKMVPEYLLTYDDIERGAVGLGANVPMSGTYPLPLYTGWQDAVASPYTQALSKRAKAPEPSV